MKYNVFCHPTTQTYLCGHDTIINLLDQKIVEPAFKMERLDNTENH